MPAHHEYSPFFISLMAQVQATQPFLKRLCEKISEAEEKRYHSCHCFPTWQAAELLAKTEDPPPSFNTLIPEYRI